jgi:hypothetical protein
VILQQDAAFRRFSEARRGLELAGGHLVAVLVGATLEFQHLHAIEPVLDAAVGARHDAGVLPGIYFRRDTHVRHELRSRIYVVQ